MRNKLYEIKFFDLCSKKMELMKQIHLVKKDLVIFLKGATFWILMRLDSQTTNPQLSESSFRCSGDFFLIRVKPHQVVYALSISFESALQIIQTPYIIFIRCMPFISIKEKHLMMIDFLSPEMSSALTLNIHLQFRII